MPRSARSLDAESERERHREVSKLLCLSKSASKILVGSEVIVCDRYAELVLAGFREKTDCDRETTDDGKEAE